MIHIILNNYSNIITFIIALIVNCIFIIKNNVINISSGDLQYVFLMTVTNDVILTLSIQAAFVCNVNITAYYSLKLIWLAQLPLVKIYVYDKALLLKEIGIKPTRSNLNRYLVLHRHQLFIFTTTRVQNKVLRKAL